MNGLRPYQGLAVDGRGGAIDRRGQLRQARLPDPLRAEEQQFFPVSFDVEVDLKVRRTEGQAPDARRGTDLAHAAQALGGFDQGDCATDALLLRQVQQRDRNRFGFRQHAACQPRLASQAQIAVEPGGIDCIDAQPHRPAWIEPAGHKVACLLLADRRDCGFEVDDDLVGVACPGLVETFRPVAGNEAIAARKDA